MKKLLFIILLLIPISAKAQSPGITLLTGTSQVGILISYDGEAITVDNTVGGVGFTASKINPTCTDCPLNVLRAIRADCTSTQSAAFMNMLSNGTAPTSAVGLTVAAGQPFTVFGYDNILAFRAIRTAATSISMYCVYSRPK